MKNYNIGNREIKFRFWDAEEKEMQESMDIASDDSVYLDQFFNMEEFIPMQFTGIKDNNGVSVFEGDIVVVYDADGDSKQHVVYWGGNSDYPAFELDPLYTDACNNLQHAISEIGYSLEVIGNIFENPELLKK